MADPTSRKTETARNPLWAAALFGLVALFVARRPHGTETEKALQGHAASPARSPAARPGPATEGSTSNSPRAPAAATPSEIPVQSWTHILWRVYEEIGNDRVLAVAAGVTFYSLLAVFPAIVALVSLYGLFADASSISDHLATLSGVLPGGALDIIGDQVKRIASKPSGSLSFGFLVGLAVALWSANAGMKAMFDALNIVYDEKEKRNFFMLNVVSLAFTIGALAVLMLSLAAVVVIPVLLKFLPLGGAADLLVRLARWPILLVLIMAGLAVLYRYGPSRQHPKWRWVTWGSGLATVGWIAGSMLFSWYVSAFGTYNETYGSLGAAIGFMTWIWLSTTIVLVGAEMNAEMEHETAEDTTKGSSKPQGTRGAAVADHVAA